MRPLRLAALGALVAGAAVLGVPGVGRAADYGYFIEVETEAELADLLASQEIDTGAYEILFQLLQEGLDLNTATRDELYGLPNLTYEEVDKIIAYRVAAGGIADPANLVAAGVLSERKVLAITPFLMEADPKGQVDFHGRVRYRSAYVVGDGQAPAMWLGTRVRTLHRALEAGVLGALTRNELGDPRWDPNRGALAAEAPDYRLRVPKFFVQYRTEQFHLIAGTFRIGFGQRLILDNTSRYSPNGIQVDEQIYFNRESSNACRESQGDLTATPCAEGAQNEYEAPDFKWPERFRGVALGYRSREFGNGSSVQAYAFASYQTRSIYQYELFDRAICSDPTGTGLECEAPPVYRIQRDPLAATSKFARSTLPNMFNELSAGGNFSWFFHRRAHLGLTGYGASSAFLTEGAQLGFQEWSRWPWGGPWGAFGADFAWGRGWFDLYGEIARSVDGQPGGGGTAAIVRATASFKKQEIELSGRYYEASYNNPFARPISAADEYQGLRASNEGGARLRYTGATGDLEVRSYLDLWWDLQRRVPQVRFRARVEYDLTAWFAPAVIVDIYDKNVEVNTGPQCFGSDDASAVPPGPLDDGTFDEARPCNGQRMQFGLNLKFTPARRLTATLRYLHRLVDDPKYPTQRRQDATAWLMTSYSPREWLQLRARARYLNLDIADAMAGEESFWLTVESMFIADRRWFVKPRYELHWMLDRRDSTLARSPNPEHWLRLDVEYRF